jgi:hypothetical protein
MSLDYRTPRQPRKPIETEETFAPFCDWTAQVYSEEHKKWLAICRRRSWSAVYEYALGYTVASWDASTSIEEGGPQNEPLLVWIVGKDGKGT